MCIRDRFRGFHALGYAHSGDRFVEHEEFGVLDEQHADLQPLLLAVAECLGGPIKLLIQIDHGGYLTNALNDLCLLYTSRCV